MSKPPQDPAAKAEERRELWSDLPSSVPTEEMTTSEDAQPPPADLVADPDHEFMIRHAG